VCEQPTPKPTSVVKAAAADKAGFMSPVLLTKDANFAFGNTQTRAANKGVFSFQAAPVNTGTVTKPTATHRVSALPRKLRLPQTERLSVLRRGNQVRLHNLDLLHVFYLHIVLY
jgi:hypothetical protein